MREGCDSNVGGLEQRLCAVSVENTNINARRNRKMKRKSGILLSMILILAMLLTSITPISAVNTEESMGSLDVMLAAFRFLSISDEDEDIWGQTTGVKEYKELYDLYGNIRAYYISFEPTGFVVINNNAENPIAIEYSMGYCQYFTGEDAQSRITDSTVYVSPMGFVSSLDANDLISRNSNSEMLANINDFYTWLDTANYEEMSHQAILMSQLVASQSRTRSSRSVHDDYNMILTANLTGTGGTTTQKLRDITYITSWGIMNEFGSSTVNNHCVTTAAFNLIIYYRFLCLGLSTTGSARATIFNSIHGYIGNGPKLLGDMANGLTSYYSSLAAIRFYDSYGGISYNTFKTGIGQDKMGAYTLFGGITTGFHTVLGVGWREYSASSHKYINIVTGWDNNLNYWIVAGSDWGSYQMWCTK